MDSGSSDRARFASPPDERLRLVAITDAGLAPWSEIVARARLALEAGLPCLLLRDLARDDAELLDYAKELRRETARHGALLLVNRRIELARSIGADGVHLGRQGPRIGEARRALGAGALIGYSAHSVAEVDAALSDGADYAFLSPIHPPRSKTGLLPALGPAVFAQVRGPAIALGGMSAANAAEAIRQGAIGIAAITEVLGASDPRPAVQALRASIRIGLQRRV